MYQLQSKVVKYPVEHVLMVTLQTQILRNVHHVLMVVPHVMVKVVLLVQLDLH